MSTPPNSKPIIYACSGCSDAGELADRIARTDRVSRWTAETEPWIFAYWQRVGRAAAVTVRVPSIL